MSKDLVKKIVDIVRKTEAERIDLTAKTKDSTASKKRRKEVARLLTEANNKTSQPVK